MGVRIGHSLAISAIGHVMVVVVLTLVWLIALPWTRTESTPALAVDMISDSELNQIMAGVKTAPQAPAPKPIVDKIGEQSPPVKDPAPKVSDKAEIAPAMRRRRPRPSPSRHPRRSRPSPRRSSRRSTRSPRP